MKLKKNFFISLLLFTIFTNPTFSQASKPDSTNHILAQAMLQAQASHKNVFLIFHASWCKWCKRLDSVLERPDIKRIIESNYIVTRLDVAEQGEKKQTLENPGASLAMKEYKGENSGLPFYVFLDENGKMMGNSNAMPDSQNIGYPGPKRRLRPLSDC